MTSEVLALGLRAVQLRRLRVGLALSVAVHLLAVAGVGTRPLPAIQWPLKLQVMLEAAPGAIKPGAVTTDAPAEASAEPSNAGKPSDKLIPEAEREIVPAHQAVANLAVSPDLYYTGQQVDVRAEQTNDVDLVFPERAYQMRVQGTVVVRLYINEKGTVDGVTVIEALPPGFFEQAAIEASVALRFSPAQRLGKQVKSQKTIEVKFDPYESINVP